MYIHVNGHKTYAYTGGKDFNPAQRNVVLIHGVLIALVIAVGVRGLGPGSVGRILAALEKQNTLADTLIVFTSDNGGVVNPGSRTGANTVAMRRTPTSASVRGIPM